jgi:hypothetical protein
VICINDHCLTQNRTTSSLVMNCVNRCLLSLDIIFTKGQVSFCGIQIRYFASRHNQTHKARGGRQTDDRQADRCRAERQILTQERLAEAGQTGSPTQGRQKEAGWEGSCSTRRKTNGGQTDKRRLDWQTDAERVADEGHANGHAG